MPGNKLIIGGGKKPSPKPTKTSLAKSTDRIKTLSEFQYEKNNVTKARKNKPRHKVKK